MQATTLAQKPLSLDDWRCWLSRGLTTVAAAIFLVGLVWKNPGLIGGGAVALCAMWASTGSATLATLTRYAPLRSRAQRIKKQQEANLGNLPPSPTPPIESPTDHLTRRIQQKPSGTAKLVDSMIAEGRFALLLRPETITELVDSEIEQVLRVMDECMSVVPEGHVLVGEYAERATWGATPTSADSVGLEWIGGCYLDRFTVSNSQFQHFVDAGGYEQFQLWPEEALPALFEFVDQSGRSAPASWSDGKFPEGEDHYPVVGVSWYEASAYARWVGRRLPTDAEWTKAGAWPVETSPGRVSQRRYPWGDTFESRRAALWSAGQNGPRPVDAYEEGASLGSVHQLIGNVWEWTTSLLESTARENAATGHGLKVIHGGAFNTYFENQATCHFRSGEQPLSRRGNVGFRLALSFDVIVDQEPLPEDEPEAASP